MDPERKELVDTLTKAMIKKCPDDSPTEIMEKVVAVAQAFHTMGLLSFKLGLEPAKIITIKEEGKL